MPCTMPSPAVLLRWPHAGQDVCHHSRDCSITLPEPLLAPQTQRASCFRMVLNSLRRLASGFG
jgi:hypothetical protein